MDNVYILNATGDLYHWGIKGMKWGVRRYQNKDGSLTAAGKKRRAKLEGELEKIGGKSTEKTISEMSDEEVTAKTNRVRLENNLRDEMRRTDVQNKNAQQITSDTSIEELRNTVSRLQLEKQYRQLQAELHPKKPSFMENLGKKALNEVLIPSAMNTGKAYLEKTLKKKLGLDTEDPVARLEKQVRKLEAEKKIEKLTKSDSSADLDSTIEKLMNLSDEDFKKVQRAASAQAVINNLSGKKNKD